MIERKILAAKMRELQVHEFLQNALHNVGHSSTKIVRTPLGEKILVSASRPGLVVGRKGENIKKLTLTLKKKFKFENPEIELVEVEQPNLDARIIAERIASGLERFGIQRFKAIGHRALTDVMGSGARGIEIHISGKVPSARAKTWRFYSGYLKKSGDAAVTIVRKAQATAKLKSGTIGVKVSIMPPNIPLPDEITVKQGVVYSATTSGTITETQTTTAQQPETPTLAKKQRKRSPKKKTPKKQETTRETPDTSAASQPPQTSTTTPETAEVTG